MGEKRIMHYRSTHKILLVGEGDFSFSLCLAKAFGTAVNMVATSLDSRVSLAQKYSHALSNVAELKVLGCTLLHEVDVHTMNDDPRLKYKKFDRIIFNFPHAGFFYDEREAFQIWFNKKLVSGFLGNAKHMLNIDGEIHITHKTTHPFTDWDIKELASREDLDFVGETLFSKGFYPGYFNKRGSGSKCNLKFPIRKSSTFKFMAPKDAQEDLNFVGESIFRKRFYPGYLNKRGSGLKCNRSFPIGKNSTFKFTIVKDPEEAQANHEQHEYLSKEPKIQAIVMDPEEAQANYEQEEYLSKGPKIQTIVMDPKEAQANYEHEEYEEEYSIKGPKIRTIVMDPREAQANYEQEEYEEEYLIKRPNIRTIVMDPEKAQANYEQEEYEEEYSSKGPKIRAKQNRVWPKWLRDFFRCLCG